MKKNMVDRIINRTLENAVNEIAELKKENKELKKSLGVYRSTVKGASKDIKAMIKQADATIKKYKRIVPL